MVGNTKGGTGKSLLSTNLAVALAEISLKVLLIDADVGQGTSADWISGREPGKVAGTSAKLANIGKAIAWGRDKGADVIVVDLGGRDDVGLKAALEAADFLLVPAQPSLPDLRATNSIVKIANAAKTPCSVMLSRVRRSESSRTEQYIQRYADSGRILPVHTTDRVSYQDAYLHNAGVTEYEPNGVAAAEIRLVRDHLLPVLMEAKNVKAR
jgi:chromosome partitioning protein